jgi:hypothetical protein
MNKKFTNPEIIFLTKEAGEEALQILTEKFNKQGKVSVGDLYKIIGVTGDDKYDKIGWTDLESIGIESVSDGYRAILPTPTDISYMTGVKINYKIPIDNLAGIDFDGDTNPWLDPKILYKQSANKLFYIGLMFGEDGICWPTDSFTDKELEIVERFLKEFNEHAEGKSIDAVAIIDNDEEEE